MPRILIVDDEAPARERLRALIREGALGEVVAEAADGPRALASCREHQPDVVLLDIRMPGMDGLEVARHLAATDGAPAVIFTTAYDRHALAAFDARAVDYLLKPVRLERLAQALARAARLAPELVADLRPAVDGDQSTRSHVGDARMLIPVAAIRLLRAEHKYVSAYSESSSVLLEESLGALEREFEGTFLRVHRNALVAIQHVEGMRRDAEGRWQMQLSGLTFEVEVSRRLAPAVRRALGE
ncbi:MAG: LytTR family DNA-binding domain-containing protein [Pseudomonadota bacterium]